MNYTRRDFIKAGAAAGVGMALATAAPAQEATASPVRVGVVGVGSRGTFLLRTLLTIPGAVVKAACDIVPERTAAAQDIVEQATGQRPEGYSNGDHDFENLCARDDLDAVICATPWAWHTPVSVAAMRAGKYAGTEVPAALTLEECRQLVSVSEETKVPCMMLENVCYFQNVLTVLRMVREGIFGEMLHCEGGYQHDCRFLMFGDDGKLTWRGEESLRRNGNQYPTHPLGPIASWLDINRGDRFTHLSSMSTPALGIKRYAARKFGADHEAARRDYLQGDVNVTTLRTHRGKTVTLYYDLSTPRPYDLIFRAQGTSGLYMGTLDKIYIEGVSPEADQYEPFAPYLEKYPHPLWTAHRTQAEATGGHGGADYIVLHEFVKAVREKVQPPMDVYDAATWSAVVPLSAQSAAANGALVEFPDFLDGRWKDRPPTGFGL